MITLLFRVAFWLTIVVLLIPPDPRSGGDAPRVAIAEAFSAARSTIDDLSTFCDRNADVCATGSGVWAMFTEKVVDGVRLLSRQFGAVDADSDGTEEPMGGTLRPDDQAPEWRGPALNGTDRVPRFATMAQPAYIEISRR